MPSNDSLVAKRCRIRRVASAEKSESRVGFHCRLHSDGTLMEYFGRASAVLLQEAQCRYLRQADRDVAPAYRSTVWPPRPERELPQERAELRAQSRSARLVPPRPDQQTALTA